jgi:hypothetical protein
VSRTETVSNAFKSVLTGAAFACAMAAAAPSHATQYFLNTATMDTSRTATIVGPGMNAHVYAGPIKFKTYEGTAAVGQSFDIVGFCVDIFHSISLGTINLKYDDNYQLTTDSKYLTNTPFGGGAATPLSNGQILQVGRLVNYGTLVFNQAPTSSAKSSTLAALQGAIWQVINPTYTVASSNGTVNTQIGQFAGAGYNGFLTGYGQVNSGIVFISETGKYGTKSARQSFAFAGPGGAAIPEPATWALMIGGFAMAGAALRRSRPRLAPVRVTAA